MLGGKGSTMRNFTIRTVHTVVIKSWSLRWVGHLARMEEEEKSLTVKREEAFRKAEAKMGGQY